MNVVSTGSIIHIYGDDVHTYKKLPVGFYDVCFDKMRGFYLTTRGELANREKKVYGPIETKTNKIVTAFNASDRNFGVILSGEKGSGKSLFARVLSQKMTDLGIPTITVSICVPGIADFLSSIEQEVMVIFDEFDKIYRVTDDGDNNPQNELLPLFDGLDNGKKLFVITCNDVDELSSYLINRPGRFHYHFVMAAPSSKEVEEYMTDKLLPEYQSLVPSVVMFSRMADLTYDILRSIAFDLNLGFSFEECLEDLNISREGYLAFDMFLTVNGKKYVYYDARMDLYEDKDRECLEFYELGNCGRNSNAGRIWFLPSNIYSEGEKLMIKPEDVEVEMDRRGDFADDDDRKDVTVEDIIFVRRNNPTVWKYRV